MAPQQELQEGRRRLGEALGSYGGHKQDEEGLRPRSGAGGHPEAPTVSRPAAWPPSTTRRKREEEGSGWPLPPTHTVASFDLPPLSLHTYAHHPFRRPLVNSRETPGTEPGT